MRERWQIGGAGIKARARAHHDLDFLRRLCFSRSYVQDNDMRFAKLPKQDGIVPFIVFPLGEDRDDAQRRRDPAYAQERRVTQGEGLQGALRELASFVPCVPFNGSVVELVWAIIPAPRASEDLIKPVGAPSSELSANEPTSQRQPDRLVASLLEPNARSIPKPSLQAEVVKGAAERIRQHSLNANVNLPRDLGFLRMVDTQPRLRREQLDRQTPSPSGGCHVPTNARAAPPHPSASPPKAQCPTEASARLPELAPLGPETIGANWLQWGRGARGRAGKLLASIAFAQGVAFGDPPSTWEFGHAGPAKARRFSGRSPGALHLEVDDFRRSSGEHAGMRRSCSVGRGKGSSFRSTRDGSFSVLTAAWRTGCTKGHP